MEDNTQRPENGDQDRIAELEAQLAAQAAELAAKQEAIDALMAAHAELQEAVTKANDAAVAAQALFAAKAPEAPADKTGAKEDDTKVLPSTPVTVTPAADSTTPPKRPVVVATTPPAGRPPKAKSEHSKRNRLVAVVAIGALALGSLFAITRNGDKHKGSDASVSTQTAESNGKFVPGPLGLDGPMAKAKAAAEKAAADAKAEEEREANEAAAKAANLKNMSAHERALERAFDAKTVAGAVDRANPTADTVKGDIRAFAEHAGIDKLDHSNGKMSSALSHFAAKEMTSPEALLHTFDSALGSPAYAAKLYNELHGNHTSKTLPAGVSNAEALKAIEKKLVEADYQVRSDLTGLGLNHGQSKERGVYSANVMSLDGKEFLVITLDDGTEVLVKFENNCANIVDRVMAKKQVTPPAAPPQVQGPKAPVAPGKPADKPEKPAKPVTPGKPADKPGQPGKPNPKPKNDPNNTGKPGGQGGNGQEQTRPQAGTPSMPGVGQEQQPLPPAETAQGGETASTEPALTGVEPVITGDATQGGPNTTTPAGQINSGTTPIGD